MIIDSHVHLDVYYTKEKSPALRVKDLKKSMKKAGVTKAIILADLVSKGKTLSFSELYKLIAKDNDLYLAVAVSVMKYTKKDLTRLDKLFKEKKAIALKLYPGYEDFYPYDEKCDALYSLCEKHKVPVIFHTGDTYGNKGPIDCARPIHIDRVALKHPKLKIIIAHLGNPWIEEAMVVIQRHKNVYADISALFFGTLKTDWALRCADKVKMVIDWCGGADKLLFGTDWPCNDPEMYDSLHEEMVNFVRTLEIGQKEEDKLFYKNAKKLFGI